MGWNKPYLHRDAFEGFVRGKMEEVREGWDNFSGDTRIERVGEGRDDGGDGMFFPRFFPCFYKRVECDTHEHACILTSTVTQSAPSSPSACQSACLANDECIQWRHREGECHIGKTLRLGEKATGGRKWTSGWMLERVAKRVEEWGRCEKASWQFNQ